MDNMVEIWYITKYSALAPFTMKVWANNKNDKSAKFYIVHSFLTIGIYPKLFDGGTEYINMIV